eukprot:snap_masked-scaffold_1-processed-gene-24.42-mRNA-1 protein AED:1.00 eAED:1.00 QI:0/0/0/0/1/1/2/0/101
MQVDTTHRLFSCTLMQTKKHVEILRGLRYRRGRFSESYNACWIIGIGEAITQSMDANACCVKPLTASLNSGEKNWKGPELNESLHQCKVAVRQNFASENDL